MIKEKRASNNKGGLVKEDVGISEREEARGLTQHCPKKSKCQAYRKGYQGKGAQKRKDSTLRTDGNSNQHPYKIAIELWGGRKTVQVERKKITAKDFWGGGGTLLEETPHTSLPSPKKHKGIIRL